jgi:polyisoprenoid-binding protein YceI
VPDPVLDADSGPRWLVARRGRLVDVVFRARFLQQKAAVFLWSLAERMPERPAEAVQMTALADAKRVPLVPRGAWEVDAKCSTVGFEVRHLKVMHVRGRFHVVTGAISCDADGVASIAGSIGVASIDTGDTRRDARLCGRDFFDVEHHPVISFAGEAPPTGARNALTVRGTMTMHGVSRPLELRAEPLWARDGNRNGEVRVRADGVLSRREFGLDWDPAFAAGGLVLDDRVVVQLDVFLSRPRATPAVTTPTA